MARKAREITVEVNYPTTPEGIAQYNESCARGVFNALRKTMSMEQLTEFMDMLRKQEEAKHNS